MPTSRPSPQPHPIARLRSIIGLGPNDIPIKQLDENGILRLARGKWVLLVLQAVAAGLAFAVFTYWDLAFAVRTTARSASSETLHRTALQVGRFLLPGVMLALGIDTLATLRACRARLRRIHARRDFLQLLLGAVSTDHAPRVLVVYPYFPSSGTNVSPLEATPDDDDSRDGASLDWLDRLDRRWAWIENYRAELEYRCTFENGKTGELSISEKAVLKDLESLVAQTALEKVQSLAGKGLIARRDLILILGIQELLREAGCPPPRVVSDVHLAERLRLSPPAGNKFVLDHDDEPVDIDHIVSVGLFSNLISAQYAAHPGSPLAFRSRPENDWAAVRLAGHRWRQSDGQAEYFDSEPTPNTERVSGDGRVAGLVLWDRLEKDNLSLTIIGGLGSMATARMANFVHQSSATVDLGTTSRHLLGSRSALMVSFDVRDRDGVGSVEGGCVVGPSPFATLTEVFRVAAEPGS